MSHVMKGGKIQHRKINDVENLGFQYQNSDTATAKILDIKAYIVRKQKRTVRSS